MYQASRRHAATALQKDWVVEAPPKIGYRSVQKPASMFGSLILCRSAVASNRDFASMSGLPLDHRDKAFEQVMAVTRTGAGLGMVLHEYAGRSMHANPSFEPSNSETCVTLAVAGSVSGSTANPWFWLVISTLSVARSFTG